MNKRVTIILELEIVDAQDNETLKEIFIEHAEKMAEKMLDEVHDIDDSLPVEVKVEDIE